MPLYVSKFGGTSLATGERLLAARDIVLADEARRAVVVSAPGRRCEGDEKVTDLLSRFARGQMEAWPKIKARFTDIAECAGMDIRDMLDEIYDRVRAGAGEVYAMSRGESITARIFARALGGAFVDAAACVRFRGETCDEAETLSRVRAACGPLRRAVIPGFYGADANGRVRVFPRGGSDITGALVARALGADAYENWTDVDGVYDRDPALHPDARLLREIAYEDMLALCRAGACVLHPDCLAPVRAAGIPVHVRNTFRPASSGTWIRDARPECVFI